MRTRSIVESMLMQKHTAWSGALLVVLRVTLGVQFFLAGITKIFSGWTTEGYLSAATGPFAQWFVALADNAFISWLNIMGLTMIGLALILGLLVRPASFFGALLMVLYYFAHFEQNTANGLIEYHIVYAILFGLMMAGGFGHAFGIDGMIFESTRGKKWWRFILFG